MAGSENIITIVVIVQSLLLLGMFIYVISRGAVPLRQAGYHKSTRDLEQQLVIESISAAASQTDLESLITSLATHATTMTEYHKWAIFMRAEDNGPFGFVQASANRNHFKSLEHLDAIGEWVLKNPYPLYLPDTIQMIIENKTRNENILSKKKAMMIPFIDRTKVLGFLILSGGEEKPVQRSIQFLSLYGAVSAILIKAAQMNQRERRLLDENRKSETLANMGKLAAKLAHEIRNPLTFIASATTFLGTEKTPEETTTTRKAIQEEIARINNRINELLSLGKVEPKSYHIIDIVELIDKACHFSYKLFQHSNTSIQHNHCQSSVSVRGDTDQLLQLIENLILNAHDAIDSNGSVTIQTDIESDTCIIDISDTGPGIPDHLITRIFDPFFTTKKKGTGLGLSICFAIAKAHAGNLKLLHSTENGSVFRLSLPITRE